MLLKISMFLGERTYNDRDEVEVEGWRVVVDVIANFTRADVPVQIATEEEVREKHYKNKNKQDCSSRKFHQGIA